MYERTGTLVQVKFQEYLLPSIMTSLAMSLASVVDGMIVGNLLGEKALAAVGLASPFIFCINLIYMFFGIGGMTSASISRGKRDFESTNRIFTATLVMGVAAMFLYVFLGQICMGPITGSLTAGDEEMAVLMTDYLRPLLFAGPALMAASGTALFMRVDGRPKISATIIIVANAVNLVLDYVLIRFFHTGIMGAGLSTTLGYVAGILLVAPYLLQKKNRTFRFVSPAKGLTVLVEVLRTGMPKGLMQLTSLGRSLILNSIVMVYIGSVGMSVMTVLLNVLMICNIFVSGTCDAMLPIAGSLYGEGDTYGTRKTVYSARRVLVAACVGLILFFWLAPEFVGRLFGVNTVEGLAAFVPALRLFTIYIPLYATLVTLQNFYNTTGRAGLASLSAVLDGFVFVCGFAFLFVQIHPNLMWLCYGAGSACTLGVILLIGIRIRRKERVSGLLFLRDANEKEKVWDLTIDGTVEQIVGLSQKIMDFGKENGGDEKMIMRVAMAVEEMALATAQYAHGNQPGVMDIMVRITDDGLTVRFRDNGKEFNPVEYQGDEGDGLITDGIAVMKAIASHVDYARQMGFNTTVIGFDQKKNPEKKEKISVEGEER